jgi:hypothetical protein
MSIPLMFSLVRSEAAPVFEETILALKDATSKSTLLYSFHSVLYIQGLLTLVPFYIF